jgi:hypothetical protein
LISCPHYTRELLRRKFSASLEQVLGADRALFTDGAFRKKYRMPPGARKSAAEVGAVTAEKVCVAKCQQQKSREVASRAFDSAGDRGERSKRVSSCLEAGC